MRAGGGGAAEMAADRAEFQSRRSRAAFPFYEALAHYKLPLLSHTGGEKTLPHA